jgi:hypothetical protein
MKHGEHYTLADPVRWRDEALDLCKANCSPTEIYLDLHSTSLSRTVGRISPTGSVVVVPKIRPLDLIEAARPERR